MAIPDNTTQDPATYKANIDATAADHETRVVALEASQVILTTPELLVSNTTISSVVWTTVNSTTLGNASAIAAIIRVMAMAESTLSTGSVTASQSVFLATSGESGFQVSNGGTTSANDVKTAAQIYSQKHNDGSNGSAKGSDTNDVLINLDVNSDFQYAITNTTLAASRVQLVLVGYYV